MEISLIILPNQLFEKKYLPKKESIKKIILYEHPQYFTKYNYNKKRLIMHRASMKYYEQYLKDNKYKVDYYEFDKKPKFPKNIAMFDPVDDLKINNENTIETPNFLLTKENYKEYYEGKKSKSTIFNNFYMWGKKKIDVLPTVKSKDKENRQVIKDESKIDIPKVRKNTQKPDIKFIEEAKKYIESKKVFENNHGNTDLENFFFPVSHDSAKKLLNDFIKNKLENYGKYQDYISKNEPYLFHSLISSCQNIGLIQPKEVVDKVLIEHEKEKFPLNSLEGFIRQIFWREYQRYCYIYYKKELKENNYFNFKNKLPKSWYNGTTGIEILDITIKKAFDSGFLHHIERLMIMGNAMLLLGIDMDDGFKWFMEFACDSYEWVMYQNVYDMVFHSTGGLTMRRPYGSSSNYILKMSNYPKGDWVEIWNKMYLDFQKSNSKKLQKYRYFFKNI